jgi:putative ABC transport system ATP-binding protein
MSKNSKRIVMETRNVKKGYNLGMDSEIYALKGVSLKIREGEFVSIMGPSGSGKTTLLDVIGCLLKPTSGEVFVDETEVEELSDNELAKIRGRKIGFIFQQYNLIASITAMENVELSLRINGASKAEARDRAKKLLEMVGLGNRTKNKPSQLSGGEQQRVAVARALANDPKIILGDEPTGNLDTKTGNKILELLRYLNKKKGYTIVVVTHDDRVMEYTDRLIKLKDGEVVKDGRK